METPAKNRSVMSNIDKSDKEPDYDSSESAETNSSIDVNITVDKQNELIQTLQRKISDLNKYDNVNENRMRDLSRLKFQLFNEIKELKRLNKISSKPKTTKLDKQNAKVNTLQWQIAEIKKLNNLDEDQERELNCLIFCLDTEVQTLKEMQDEVKLPEHDGPDTISEGNKKIAGGDSEVLNKTDSKQTIYNESNLKQNLKVYQNYAIVDRQNEIINSLKRQIDELEKSEDLTEERRRDLRRLKFSLEHETNELERIKNEISQPKPLNLDRPNEQINTLKSQMSEMKNLSGLDSHQERKSNGLRISLHSEAVEGVHEEPKLFKKNPNAEYVDLVPTYDEDQQMHTENVEQTFHSYLYLEEDIANLEQQIDLSKQKLSTGLYDELSIDLKNMDTQLDSVRQKLNNKVYAPTIQNNNEKYKILLNKYQKKNLEFENLRRKFETLCMANCGGNGTKNEQSDKLHNMYKNKLKHFTDTEEEYKMIIVEQNQQIDQYRQKFMKAQQKVLEQHAQLEKMNQLTEQIQEQTNEQVNNMKRGFQEKIRDLLPLRKEVELKELQLKELKLACDELNRKLSIVCGDLNKHKEELKRLKGIGNGKDEASWKIKCNIVCAELNKMKSVNIIQRKENEHLEKSLKESQNEKTDIKTKSNKILARTKEHCADLKAQIAQLEYDLIQTRANAAFVLAERKNVIHTMEIKLNELMENFEDAQGQISKLKAQINQMY